MGTWIKYFCDGTKESGSDIEIQKGVSSWSKGRLNDIQRVAISDRFSFCTVDMPDTEWHQFDRMSVPMTYGIIEPNRQYRVIQALVKQEHVNLSLYHQVPTSYIIVADRVPDMRPEDFIEKISDNRVGKWLTIILRKNKIPFVVFSERGKINE